MVNPSLIKKIKQSCLAIGLVNEKNNQMVSISGSGFIIDENGIILTALHVVDACNTGAIWHKRVHGINTKPAIFRPIHSSTQLDFDTAKIRNFEIIRYQEKIKQDPLFVMDLAVGKLDAKILQCIPLEIKKPHKLQVYDEVSICGYPSGQNSLDTTGKNIGIRFSPIFQAGRIAGLLPFDDAELPYGIQTDIVGVGGSSGSPLIDPNDGTVIGIAQRVLPADVEVDIGKIETVDGKLQNKTVKGYGIAKTGLIYGLTNHVLHPLVISVREHYATGKPINFRIDATALKMQYKSQIDDS